MMGIFKVCFIIGFIGMALSIIWIGTGIIAKSFLTIWILSLCGILASVE
jgi:hypothetical protein